MKYDNARKQAEYEAQARRRRIVHAGALSQAKRLFIKFGGAARLAHLLTLAGRPRTYATVFRWDYPKNKGGTGGIVPSSAWPDIFLAARLEGLFITSEDLDPRCKFSNDIDLKAFPENIPKSRPTQTRYTIKGETLDKTPWNI